MPYVASSWSMAGVPVGMLPRLSCCIQGSSESAATARSLIVKVGYRWMSNLSTTVSRAGRSELYTATNAFMAVSAHDGSMATESVHVVPLLNVRVKASLSASSRYRATTLSGAGQGAMNGCADALNGATS